MSSQPQSKDLSKHRGYLIATLITAVVAAIAQALGLLPLYKIYPTETPINTPGVEISVPPSVEPPPTQNPPNTNPPTTQSLMLQNLCGGWFSETSQKRYDFVCQAQAYFDIYDVTDQGRNKVGSGKMLEGGTIEANILVLKKNRIAHLTLSISADGRKMNGSWQGNDPREFGKITFHKI